MVNVFSAVVISIVKNKLLKGAFIVSCMGALSVLINFVSTPILASLFSPNQLGEAALVLAVSMCLAPISSLRLEYAILKDKNNSNSILQLSVFTALIMFFIQAGVIFIFSSCGYVNISPGIILSTCLIAFFYSQSTIISNLFIRDECYLAFGSVQLFQSMIRVGVFLIFSYMLLHDSLGFVYLFSSFLTLIFILILCFKLRAIVNALEIISKNKLKNTFLEYKELMLHSSSTTILNAAGSNLMPLILSLHYSASIAGLIFVMQQCLMVPFQVLTGAFWKLIYAKLVNMNNFVLKAKFVREVYLYSSSLFISIALIILVVGHWVLDYASSEWEVIRGVFPYFVIMVVMNSISNICSYFVAFDSYKEESIWNVSAFILRVSILFFIPLVAHASIVSLSIYLASVSFFYFALNCYWAFKLSFLKTFFVNSIFLMAPVVSFILIVDTRSIYASATAALLSTCIVVFSGIRYKVNNEA